MSEEFEKQIMEAATKATSRPIYVYQLPEQIATAIGFKELGLVELFPEETMMAYRRGRANSVRTGYEQTLEALRYADGRKLSTSDGSADKVWNSLGEYSRELLMAAYTNISDPTKEELHSFLTSVTVMTNSSGRALHRYMIPAEIAKASGINTIGIIELTALEIAAISEMAENNSFMLAHALGQAALNQVNEQTVPMPDGTPDSESNRYWKALGEKGRMLVIRAYGKIHTPEQKEVTSFLASRKVVVD